MGGDDFAHKWNVLLCKGDNPLVSEIEVRR